jgi:hypothetical protein
VGAFVVFSGVTIVERRRQFDLTDIPIDEALLILITNSIALRFIVLNGL